MTEYLLIALLAVGASFVERTTGFGFGIFIMTVLPFLMPSYGEATTLSGLLAFATTLIICIRMWNLIDWKHLWLILGTFIVVSAGAINVLVLLIPLITIPYVSRSLTSSGVGSFSYASSLVTYFAA
ncbi:MAG: hypothetical protein SPK76_03035, partial [Bacteroidales bacterium]|nr:hypothetical protein [Bacteroidales bacterium]